MNNKSKLVIVILSSLLLQSCSILFLKLRNKLSSSSYSSYGKPCEVKFSIYLEGYKRRPTNSSFAWLHLDPYYEDRLQEYIDTTIEIFREKNCTAEHVEYGKENLKIRIVKAGFRRAAPQDYLTGLSLGLIPSWKTDLDEYKFYFDNVSVKRHVNYSVDMKTYAHLVFFPVFLVTFFTLNEMPYYENAMRNFIENS